MPPDLVVHHRACPLCEAMCGLTIEARAGRVASIRGDELDPFSQGHLCPKALALKDLHEDPDRLHTPLRRVGTRWESVSWADALDEAAERLHRIQVRHGANAVAAYLGNPTVHNVGASLFAPLFLRALKTRSRYSATSVDQLPSQLAAHWMLGHQLLFPVPDVDRTAYFLMLGANPLASNGSLMTAPGIRARLDGLRHRGGKLVVVDPRRTETAERADEHHFIAPGTDALLLLGLVHVVLEQPERLGRLADFTDGLEALREVAARFPPERVAPATRIPAATIARLAQEFLAAPSAVAYGRVGTSTQPFGALCAWLITALNVVTGNLDRPGGAMFPAPAFDPRTLPRALGAGPGSHGRFHSRVRHLPESGGELPVATLAEDMLTPGEGQLKGLVTIAGNPVLSTPNGRQLERALAGLDFMVSVDPYLNETTRHAHLLLPPPSPLERSQYDVVFHLLQVRNTARYAPPLFEAGPDARQDWQILAGLAQRLEARRGQRTTWRALTWAALERFGPEGVLELGLRLGPRGGLFGLSLAKLRRAPHGLDLGPLQPRLPAALLTPSRRLQLAPPPLLGDLPRLEAYLTRPAPPPGTLQLINRRHLRDNNSWMHNVPQLMRGAPRCTLLMHPDDAGARGLAAGALARLRSRAGEVVVPVELSDRVMPGVVSLPHGYGHHRPGVRLTQAARHAGESVNDVTDELEVDALSGVAAFSGLEVSVLPAG
jgi:anaerobic selenocysteine-containing dehydrogenase